MENVKCNGCAAHVVATGCVNGFSGEPCDNPVPVLTREKFLTHVGDSMEFRGIHDSATGLIENILNYVASQGFVNEEDECELLCSLLDGVVDEGAVVGYLAGRKSK